MLSHSQATRPEAITDARTTLGLDGEGTMATARAPAAAAAETTTMQVGAAAVATGATMATVAAGTTTTTGEVVVGEVAMTIMAGTVAAVAMGPDVATMTTIAAEEAVAIVVGVVAGGMAVAAAVEDGTSAPTCTGALRHDAARRLRARCPSPSVAAP